MGSSFTVVNDTETTVYISSSVPWGQVAAWMWAIVAIVGYFTMNILSYGAYGLAGLAFGFGSSTYGAVRYIGMMIAITGTNWATQQVVAILWTYGTGVGLTALASGGLIDNAGSTDEQIELEEMQATTLETLEGMTRLNPGEAYMFSGTLSLVRNVKVIYDDGQSMDTNCWTGSTANSNREYSIMDPKFASSAYVGCWVDADAGATTEWTGTDGVTRTLNTRLMEVRMDDIYWRSTCEEQCFGYEFYGIENEDECWCSNNMDFLTEDLMKERITEVFDCGDDLTDAYGGSWRMAVYKLTPSPLYLETFDVIEQAQFQRRLQITEGSGDEKILRAIRAKINRPVLTSADLAMDPRLLPAEKRDMVKREVLEKPHTKIYERRLEGEFDHDMMALRLAEWVELAEGAQVPDSTHCGSLLDQACGDCMQCAMCLEYNNFPICSTPTCTACGHCAQYPACLAVEKHCAPTSDVANAMENCEVDEEMTNCSQLRNIMQCVSEKVFA